MSAKSRRQYHDLQAARRAAHAVFDLLWREDHFSRPGAYRWLSEATGIRREECHFSQFDVGLCEAVMVIARRKLRELRKAAKALKKRTTGNRLAGKGKVPAWAR